MRCWTMFTDAAVQSVIKDGYVVGERYASGASADSWDQLSVAKSFYSAAIGVALDENWSSRRTSQPAISYGVDWR